MKKFLIPLAVFAALGALLAYGLLLDPRKIPSPLIGKPLPAFSLPTIADGARIVDNEHLRGRVYLLNVWASWCVTCRQEHPLLNAMAREKRVAIIGLNYKDKPDDARAWLSALGNPYELSLADRDGRLGINLGVYGVPETFVIDREGIIRYKHVGAITPRVLEQELLPVIEKLDAAGTTATAR